MGEKMSSFREMPSLSTILSFYASVSAMFMVVRTIVNEMIPRPMRDLISSKLCKFLSLSFSSDFTFTVEERWQSFSSNTYRAVQVYLPTIVGDSVDSLLIGSSREDESVPELGIPVDAEVIDNFEGMRLKWTLRRKEQKEYNVPERKFFLLTCKKIYRDRVLQNYIPHICRTAQTIFNKRKDIKIYTYHPKVRNGGDWDSIVFKHPSTFETLAMDPDLKQSIMEDLNLFVNRKGYFHNVGRAWKRGYLLYGPPGTGKSSLVAAIANHLRYNIYDLQIQSVKSDADLRRILTSTTNRSIILIEDIDCSAKVSHDRGRVSEPKQDNDEKANQGFIDPGATLSGLLNFIDGLWSSCGEERIIIFTTNHKEKLDPALLRPGRMDVHIEMGYCTSSGFRKLANTYLRIEDHHLFESIETLIQSVEVTPAEVAQQLMKRDNAGIALESLVEFLNMKKKEQEKGGVQREEAEVIKEEDDKQVKEM